MIDWARVNELREEIGVEDFDEVVELFLEEVDEIIERLVSSPDTLTYEDDLHFLKGSASNLGFRDFYALCAAGEQKSAAGNHADVQITEITASYLASRAQFLNHISTEAAA